MKLKIGIGITTYQDISSPDFAAIVYDAYSATSPKIVPTRVDVWSKKHEVTDRNAFSAHWLTELEYRVIENRSKSSAILEKGSTALGPNGGQQGTSQDKVQSRSGPSSTPLEPTR